MNKNIWTYLRGDKTIWVIVFILSFFSLSAIYSSAGVLEFGRSGGRPVEFHFLRHSLLLFFGLGIMWIAHKIPYVYYSRISQLMLLVAIPALIWALVSPHEINQAARWVMLIPAINLTFQPSDLAKLALVMYTARILAKDKDRITERGPFLHIMIPSLAVCALIFPSNFSTAALVFLTAIVMMFVGQINLRYISSTLAVCLTGLVLMFSVLTLMPEDRLNQMGGRMPTWQARMDRHFNPDGSRENYQIERAKMAIASGGFFGQGPGNSTRRTPLGYSDFIYATIIEEYGFLGGVTILMLYLMLMFRAISISRKCEGTFGSYLVFGIAFVLVSQAFVNMAVVVGLMPVTGQVLPFLSMGGTSLWLTSLGIGIILSVSADVQLKGENIDILKPQSAEEIAEEMGIER